MSVYTGYLIRRERLARNLSQEGLAKGVCATSYLSKIEQGLVEPGQEIIDRLFAALEIDFVRDAQLESEAQRQLERYFFLLDGGEPCDGPDAFFAAHGGELARSEFALAYQVYRLYTVARSENDGGTGALLDGLRPFMCCLSAGLRQRVLIIEAEFAQTQEETWALLQQAAQLGQTSLIAYKLGLCAYHSGRYSQSVELTEQAYALACSEGSPLVMIWSNFLLGSCACNRYDVAQARRCYDRARALARGYRENMDNYANYNLGSTYLEMGDDENALRYLREAGEEKDDAFHNTLLHQKMAIVCQRTGAREEGLAHLALAKERFAANTWMQERHNPALLAKMLRFAELVFEAEPMALPEFEQVTRELYSEAGTWYGYGFRRFYGRYLVQLYKRQRRYKEALLVQEEMENGEFPEK